MTFAAKIRYDIIFHQVTHKVGESAMNYIKRFPYAQSLSVSVGNNYSEDQLMHISWITFTKVENIMYK